MDSRAGSANNASSRCCEPKLDPYRLGGTALREQPPGYPRRAPPLSGQRPPGLPHGRASDLARRLLADHDLLRPDADLSWIALHSVVIILGTIMLRDSIDRHLPHPFFTPEQLDRWNTAGNALFREGA